MYEISTKETKWVCIQLACSRRPRAFEEAHCWNIQAKFYNEKFPLVYESDKIRDSLSWRSWCYFEAQVWKKDSNIVASLFFSHLFIMFSFFIWAFFIFFFWAFSFFWPLPFFHPESHPNLWGNHCLHHPFLTWDNALIIKIITLLFTYNSRITTRYLEQDMTLYECLRRCTGIAMNQEWHVWKIMNGGFATDMMSTTWSCKAIWQWWSVS